MPRHLCALLALLLPLVGCPATQVVPDDDDSADDDDAVDDDDAIDDDDSGDDDDSVVDAQIDDLEAHLQLFVDTWFADGDLDFELQVEGRVDGDADAWTAEILGSWHVLDHSLRNGLEQGTQGLIQLAGQGASSFGAQIVTPRLLDGAAVVAVTWTLDDASATNLAVVAPGGGEPGDTAAFLEAAVQGWRGLDGARDGSSWVVLDAFGQETATFEASVACGGSTCDSTVSASEDAPGCDVQTEDSTTCNEAGECVLSAALVGWCGEPSFDFDADDNQLVQEANTFGFAWFDASLTFTEACGCDVNADDDNDGVTVGQGDCDDTDAAVHPGATESCDDVDSDCDGSLADEFDDADLDDEPDCIDLDDDGDGSSDLDDCDPLDPSIHPGAPELCDGVDQDCDGSLADEDTDTDGDGSPDCVDLDDDGDGTDDGLDCGPLDAAVYPGAEELCDDLDSDCDGSLADEFVDYDGDDLPDCVDTDSDNDGSDDVDDCAPFVSTIHPGATEICEDVIDSDCDGSLVDEFPDTDGDGTADCIDQDDDGDGVNDAIDCAPEDGDVYQGAPEDCDDVDSDCDGSLVDGFADTDGDDDPDCTDPDDDNDGFADADDCLPQDASAYPGAPEDCDLVDDNCDGDVLDGFVDTDGDLMADCVDEDDDNDLFPDVVDCDPLDPNVYPYAPELCDFIDQDCDGDAVEGYEDSDGDLNPDCTDEDDDNDGDPDVTDCEPLDPTRFNGATEICDDIDQDCDGDLLESFDDYDGDLDPDCTDEDDDADGDPDVTDCDDLDPLIYTGAPEICDDGIDQDCSGSDQSCAATLNNEIPGGNGWIYASLDDVNPSLQYGQHSNNCQTTFFTMPDGWEWAPEEAASITIIAANIWSTHCMFVNTGVSYGVNTYNNGGGCGCSGPQCVEQVGNQYRATSCSRRFLIRKPG